MNQLLFYRLFVFSDFWRLVSAVTYAVAAIGMIVLNGSLFAFINLLFVSFAVGNRLNQLHNLPHGRLLPNYLRDQTRFGHWIILALGVLPLLLTAGSMDDLLFVCSAGLLLVGASLLLCHVFNAWSLLWLLSLSIFSVFDAWSLNNTLPYGVMAVAGLFLLLLYFYMQSKGRDIKNNVVSIWVHNEIPKSLENLDFGFSFLPLPRPKNPKSVYTLLYTGLNPVLVLLSAAVGVIMLDSVFEISQTDKPTHLMGIFIIGVIASAQDFTRFGDLNRLWLASHYDSKEVFLISIAMVQTISALTPSVLFLTYFAIKYGLDSSILFSVFAYGTSAALLMISFALARWFLVVGFTVAAIIFFILTTQVGPMGSLALCIVFWGLCLLYYVKRSGHRFGALVPPQLLVNFL